MSSEPDNSRPPSNAELELLKCLWRRKACSARELHDCAGPRLGWSYSSTRKTLERMVEKGLVGHIKVEGPENPEVFATTPAPAM